MAYEGTWFTFHFEKIGYNHYCKAVTESSTEQPTQQTQFVKI